MDELQHGYGEQGRARQKQKGGITRDLGVVASRLDATDRQEERAKWLLDRIDIKDEILTSGPIELAVLAVVSLVIDEDRTRFARHADGTDDSEAPASVERDRITEPKMQTVLRDTAFEGLCDEFDLDKREVRRVRQRVRETEVYKSPNS